MRTLALAQVYQLIEPGPVVLLTTSHRGIPNVMAMSWHMMVEFTPPQIACIVSNRNHSFKALRRSMPEQTAGLQIWLSLMDAYITVWVLNKPHCGFAIIPL